MPGTSVLPMRSGGGGNASRYTMRITYDPIPEETDAELLGLEGEGGGSGQQLRGSRWWSGAWPVMVSLLLFSAGLMGSTLTSRKAAVPKQALPSQFRAQQDRTTLSMRAKQQHHHEQQQDMKKHHQKHQPTRANVVAKASTTSKEERKESTHQHEQQLSSLSSVCPVESTFSWTVSDCDCDSTQVVLAGADPVAYFSLEQGQPWVPGSPDYTATLNGYTFYFSSAENQAKFEADPWTYAPSYGAFCSWGMAEERMPDYNWEPSNLGPNADLDLWLVRDGRLFFFYKAEAMEKFLVDPDQFVLDGDERWSSWFGDKETSPFNTACYVQESRRRRAA